MVKEDGWRDGNEGRWRDGDEGGWRDGDERGWRDGEGWMEGGMGMKKDRERKKDGLSDE